MSDQQDFVGEERRGEKDEAGEVHKWHTAWIADANHHYGNHSRKTLLSIKFITRIKLIKIILGQLFSIDFVITIIFHVFLHIQFLVAIHKSFQVYFSKCFQFADIGDYGTNENGKTQLSSFFIIPVGVEPCIAVVWVRTLLHDNFCWASWVEILNKYNDGHIEILEHYNIHKRT